MRYLSIISILLILTGRPCLAEEKNYFWEFGWHKGGDQIPSEEMAPQHNTSVSAGGGISVSLGWIYRLNQRFSITPSIGLKYNTSRLALFISDVTDLKTTILNLPFLYRFNDWQLGAGFTYHYKPTLSASNESEAYDEEWEFDNSIGSSVKLDYYYNSEDSIGLQYMKIDYTRAGAKTVNGDNIALIWRIVFSL